MSKKQQDKDLIRDSTEQGEVVSYEHLLRCVCGHLKKQHTPNALPHYYSSDSFCSECAYREIEDKAWHNFQLDNLSLVEEVARKRKLI
jgi:hypothetical protein